MNASIRWLLSLMLVLVTTLAQAGTKHYYYTDAQGTVLAKADAQGNIVASYDYAPYGAQVLGTPPSGPAGYTGHVNDAESGFVYMQQRYYDPGIGRFLSVDPVAPKAGNGFGFNRYVYANDNPYRYIDPDGMNPKDKWYGFNDRKFQDWVHSEKQTLGRGAAQNYTKAELADLHREWTKQGKPAGKGGFGKPGHASGKWQRGVSSPSLLFKLGVTLQIITYVGDLNEGEQSALDEIRREAEEKGKNKNEDEDKDRNNKKSEEEDGKRALQWSL